IGMAVPGDYKGNILFCFENGKCAKIPMESYATKSNRRRLTGAYSAKSEAVAMYQLKEETDIILINSMDKALCVNTEKISLKTTRSTQGIGVMTLRRGATVKEAYIASNSPYANAKIYRPRNIPAAGAALSDEDKGIEQMSFV
ncbi:MAG: topoisomerase IV, partial [Clostridia bacterium]|nr:topoisomerase IV [Clostridia bacterium]